jgi:hypothetical protein
MSGQNYMEFWEMCDHIDANIFTGDRFSDNEERARFEDMLVRWSRRLKDWEDVEAERRKEENIEMEEELIKSASQTEIERRISSAQMRAMQEIEYVRDLCVRSRELLNIGHRPYKIAAHSASADHAIVHWEALSEAKAVIEGGS